MTKQLTPSHIRFAKEFIAAGSGHDRVARMVGVSRDQLTAALRPEVPAQHSVGFWNHQPCDWLKPLAARLEATTERIQSAQVVARSIIEGRKMSKASEIAERLKTSRAEFSRDLDAIAAKLDSFDAKKPAVLQQANATIDQLHAETDGLESELQLLANLSPLDK